MADRKDAKDNTVVQSEAQSKEQSIHNIITQLADAKVDPAVRYSGLSSLMVSVPDSVPSADNGYMAQIASSLFAPQPPPIYTPEQLLAHRVALVVQLLTEFSRQVNTLRSSGNKFAENLIADFQKVMRQMCEDPTTCGTWGKLIIDAINAQTTFEAQARVFQAAVDLLPEVVLQVVLKSVVPPMLQECKDDRVCVARAKLMVRAVAAQPTSDAQAKLFQMIAGLLPQGPDSVHLAQQLRYRLYCAALKSPEIAKDAVAFFKQLYPVDNELGLKSGGREWTQLQVFVNDTGNGIFTESERKAASAVVEAVNRNCALERQRTEEVSAGAAKL